jgi:Fe-S-cluster containining protein
MINLKSFRAKAKKQKPAMVKFLRKFDKKFIPNMLPTQLQINEEVWKEINCLECANCCKTMTPTFTKTDKIRIAKHLNTSVKALEDKYMMLDEESKDWVNKKQPCQWLDNKTNMCSIYEVRPLDCATFPHHNKKRFDNWNHIYEQNIDKCPATNLLVQKIQAWVEAEYQF